MVAEMMMGVDRNGEGGRAEKGEDQGKYMSMGSEGSSRAEELL